MTQTLLFPLCDCGGGSSLPSTTTRPNALCALEASAGREVNCLLLRSEYAAVDRRGAASRAWDYACSDSAGGRRVSREVVRERASELRDRGHLGACRHEEVPELAHLAFGSRYGSAVVIRIRWCDNGGGRALVVLVRVHQTARRVAERAPAGVPGAAVLHVLHAALERDELGFPLLAECECARGWRGSHRGTALLVVVVMLLVLLLGLRFMMAASARDGGGRRNRGRRWHWDLKIESEL